jgi:DNA polymerase-1
MSDKKRLFLLDAFALIFRGYYAFIKNPRINSKGMDTSAILGFHQFSTRCNKKRKTRSFSCLF